MARKALLVGINQYPAPNRLNGCVNDVMQMRDVLMQRFGFAPQDVKLVLDGDATYAAMEAGLAWLAEPMPGEGPGDVRVFHYSGHGSQVADTDGDEPDGADECIVPVDFQTRGMFVDDRLGQLYDRVPETSSLTMILDSCHSGTAQRPVLRPDVTFRFIATPPQEMAAIERAHEKYVADRETFVRGQLRDLMARGPVSDEEFERLYKAARDNFDGARSRYGDVNSRERNILLAGCRDNQTSADAHIAGAYHGAFTYYLIDAITKLGAKASHRAVMDATAKGLAAGGYEQIPQLEGRGPNKDLPLFSPLP